MGKFILKKLEHFIEEYKVELENRDLDLKIVTIVAQTIVGAKLETRFHITFEDIESAVTMHKTTLATEKEFADIKAKVQQAMGKLMAGSCNAVSLSLRWAR